MDEATVQYAVILYSDGAEIGRVLFEACDAEQAACEGDGILNGLVDEGFVYETYAILRIG